MSRGHQTIAVHRERCDGCGKCVEACATLKTGSPGPEASRIKVAGDGKRASFGLAVCRQCADPRCVSCCPSGALLRDEEAGVVTWSEEKCVACGLCTLACPYGGISLDPVSGKVMKCDQCEGKPACVEVCDRGALELTTSSEIYNTWGDLEDLVVPGISSCLGCNSELLFRHTLRRIGSNVVLATPPAV